MRTLTSADLVLLASFLISAIALILQAGRGALLQKRDWKSAYRQCGVWPGDWELCGFRVGNLFFMDTRLAFGLYGQPRQFFAGTRICCSGFFGTSATYSRQQNFTTITFSYLLRIILHPSSKAQLPYPTGSMLFVRSWVSNLSQRSA